jgi:serine protease Do
MYRNENGTSYLVTNRHVVQQAYTARVVFESLDGPVTSYDDVPIIYADDEIDMAVLELPPSLKAAGFPIQEGRAEDGDFVYAAGFPGLGGRLLWQLSAGIISNAAVRIDSHYEYLLQHTASIDRGNSGGPLLVRDADSPAGYAVVGINTSKAARRENTGFAIPTVHIREVIDRVDNVRATEADPRALAAELEAEAQALARVLASAAPTPEELGRFVAYAFVATRGFQSYLDVLSLVPNREEWMKKLVSDPVETMRGAVNFRFWYDLSRYGDRSNISFSHLNPVDLSRIAELSDIRSTYMVNGRPTEILWTREYGHWRVKYAAARDLVDINSISHPKR